VLSITSDFFSVCREIAIVLPCPSEGKSPFSGGGGVGGLVPSMIFSRRRPRTSRHFPNGSRSPQRRPRALIARIFEPNVHRDRGSGFSVFSRVRTCKRHFLSHGVYHLFDDTRAVPLVQLISRPPTPDGHPLDDACDSLCRSTMRWACKIMNVILPILVVASFKSARFVFSFSPRLLSRRLFTA